MHKKAKTSLGYYLYPLGNYSNIIDIIQLTISSNINGKLQAASTSSDRLSAEQIRILKNAVLDSNIYISINFKLKNNNSENGANSAEFTGKLKLKVTPDTEAEFPGGYVAFNNYINLHFFKNISNKSAGRHAQVQFQINKEGKVSSSKLTNTTGDANIDKKLLEIINAMPTWKPAKNAKKENIKQEFNIAMGNDGC